MPRHHFDGEKPAPKTSREKSVVKPDSRADDASASPSIRRDNYDPRHATGENTGRPVKGLRFVSGLIDLVVVFMVLIVLSILFAATGAFVGGEDLSDGAATLVLFGYVGVCFAYGLFMESSRFQGTIGKILTGTVIVNKQGGRISFGQALGRNFGKWLTYFIPFFIGYFMVLFTEKGQSLHDLMAGTLVYKKGDVPQTYAETFS